MMATKPNTRARRCSSSPVGVYNVQSHTDEKKRYDIVITEDGRNTCTCPAWAIKRNRLGGLSAIGSPECTCKHINALLATTPGCGWNSETGETPQFETVCPRCYNDTVLYDTRFTKDVDLDVLMADFLALSSRLRK